MNPTNQSQLKTGEPKTQIHLSKVKKLEKRMGARVWDGVLFNRDGIIDPILTIMPNKVGREIREILALEESNQ